ncbi:hypothetical protein EV204_102102 [Tissierella praeacuta]|uniref:hypothetical protein n=1 Tax=Tissierella praeacuta TaxID=43131 RepID=UPI00104A5C85|nr:hypothetical protein [Tissierella praeacuta]TCU77243.1 hypothetical protein EV204_102102 [Tissierella praeacuta]
MSIKRNKINRMNIVVGIFFIIIIIFGVKYKYQHTFSTNRWIKYPRERVKMVDDMLRKYKLVGQTKEEILELLGDETNTDYFKEVNNIVYYLGDERGFISIDSEWLVITFYNDVVVEVKIETD